MADDDEREEELSSLSAIFPELTIDANDQFSASLELPVTPTSPLLIRFIPTKPQGTGTKTFYIGPEATNVAYIERDIELTHLPPLSLKIRLPPQYPSTSLPKVRLSTQHKWLPKDKLVELEKDVEALWEEYGHCQILFAYIDHLQQAAERGFDLDQSAEGCLVLPVTMEERLVAYSTETKQAIFNAGTYDCGICIEPKKGSACHQLKSCGHIFCRQCLQDFYNNAIKEGDVAGVRCLAPDCGEEIGNRGGKKTKRKRSIQPKELLAMGIQESVVRRYVELKRKKKLEADKNTIYCPRQWCQGIAKRKEYPPIPADLFTYEPEPSSDEEHDGQAKSTTKGDTNSQGFKISVKPADRLAICEKCQFAFCRVCYGGWHGEFARCHPRDPNELSAEDKASYDWILLHTSPCPTCNSPTQKSVGCNHMKCFQCNTHFCYLCSSWLDGQMPYKHFNTRGTKCFQRLFELRDGDEGQAPADDPMRQWEQLALEVAREAEAEEAAAIAQVEEDARAAREIRVREDMAERPAAVANVPPIIDGVDNRNLNAEGVQLGRRNGGRRQRNPFPAHPPAAGAANAVRGHEGNRRAGNGIVRVRQGSVEEGRGQAELQRFVELALRDEEDAWDSDSTLR